MSKKFRKGKFFYFIFLNNDSDTMLEMSFKLNSILQN